MKSGRITFILPISLIVLTSLLASLCAAQPKDIEISLVTPFGSPLASATVRVEYPDGRVLYITSDSIGRVIIPRVPEEGVMLVVETWKGFDVGYTVRVAAFSGTITVENIGKLVVIVVGARGQPVVNARVHVSGAGAEAEGYTDVNGRFSLELPAGSYTVRAERGGKTAEAIVIVSPGPAVSEAPALRLDIFVSIAGWELGFGEFIGLVILAIAAIWLLSIAVREYVIWRRRRIAMAIVPRSQDHEAAGRSRALGVLGYTGPAARRRERRSMELEPAALLATALLALLVVLPAFYLVFTYVFPGNFLLVSVISIIATLIVARRLYPLLYDYLAKKQ